MLRPYPPRAAAGILARGSSLPTNHKEKRAIEAKDLALTIAHIIQEKQGEDIAILDVSGPLVIADYFVITTARNTRHARAIATALDYTMKQSGRLRRNAAYGAAESTWVLLDFDDVVVHIFQDDSRSFYDLESLWGDVPRVPVPAAEPAGDLAKTFDSFPDSTGTL
jgi:ribosome-associated protein